MDITLTSLEAEHSQLLSSKISAEISANGGWIPLPLYANGLIRTWYGLLQRWGP